MKALVSLPDKDKDRDRAGYRLREEKRSTDIFDDEADGATDFNGNESSNAMEEKERLESAEIDSLSVTKPPMDRNRANNALTRFDRAADGSAGFESFNQFERVIASGGTVSSSDAAVSARKEELIGLATQLAQSILSAANSLEQDLLIARSEDGIGSEEESANEAVAVLVDSSLPQLQSNVPEILAEGEVQPHPTDTITIGSGPKRQPEPENSAAPSEPLASAKNVFVGSALFPTTVDSPKTTERFKLPVPSSPKSHPKRRSDPPSPIVSSSPASALTPVVADAPPSPSGRLAVDALSSAVAVAVRPARPGGSFMSPTRSHSPARRIGEPSTASVSFDEPDPVYRQDDSGGGGGGGHRGIKDDLSTSFADAVKITGKSALDVPTSGPQRSRPALSSESSKPNASPSSEKKEAAVTAADGSTPLAITSFSKAPKSNKTTPARPPPRLIAPAASSSGRAEKRPAVPRRAVSAKGSGSNSSSNAAAMRAFSRSIPFAAEPISGDAGEAAAVLSSSAESAEAGASVDDRFEEQRTADEGTERAGGDEFSAVAAPVILEGAEAAGTIENAAAAMEPLPIDSGVAESGAGEGDIAAAAGSTASRWADEVAELIDKTAAGDTNAEAGGSADDADDIRSRVYLESYLSQYQTVPEDVVDDDRNRDLKVKLSAFARHISSKQHGNKWKCTVCLGVKVSAMKAAGVTALADISFECLCDAVSARAQTTNSGIRKHLKSADGNKIGRMWSDGKNLGTKEREGVGSGKRSETLLGGIEAVAGDSAHFSTRLASKLRRPITSPDSSESSSLFITDFAQMFHSTAVAKSSGHSVDVPLRPVQGYNALPPHSASRQARHVPSRRDDSSTAVTAAAVPITDNNSTTTARPAENDEGMIQPKVTRLQHQIAKTTHESPMQPASKLVSGDNMLDMFYPQVGLVGGSHPSVSEVKGTSGISHGPKVSAGDVGSAAPSGVIRVTVVPSTRARLGAGLLSQSNSFNVPDFDDEIFDAPAPAPSAGAIVPSIADDFPPPSGLGVSTAVSIDTSYAAAVTRPAEPAPSMASPARARRRIIATALGSN